jgi:hypothetical protein
MNFFVNTSHRNPNIAICVHPLLLSLAAIMEASEDNPDISSMSETDKRALNSPFYNSASTLLLLEIHFPGKNGLSLLPNQNDYTLTSVANCRECIAFAPQDHSGGESNATQGHSAATLHAQEDNLAHIGSASLNMPNKRRKRRRTSLGGVKGNLPSTHGPNLARIMHRAKGKQAQRVGSLDANPSSPEEQPGTSSQKSRDREAEPCMFTRVPAQHFADDICCSLNA